MLASWRLASTAELCATASPTDNSSTFGILKCGTLRAVNIFHLCLVSSLPFVGTGIKILGCFVDLLSM